MKKMTSIIMTLVLVAGLVVSAPTSYAQAPAIESEEFACTITAGAVDKDYMAYGSKAVTKMTSAQVEAEGIATGSQGDVYKVEGLSSGATNLGALVDFTGHNLPISIVDSITFRVYINGNASGSYPEVRIARPGYVNNHWLMRYKAATLTRQWIDIELGCDGALFNDKSYTWDMFAANGILGKFELSVRNNATTTFYIDSITVKMKKNDGVAPVITSDDTLYFSNASQTTATAYDEAEKRSVEVKYVWPEGTAFDKDGLPTPGIYSLTLTAQDYYGNIATKTVKAVVIANDTEAPVISVRADKIYATTGTVPYLTASATDNSGVDPDVTCAWSEGALDARKRLTVGTHTWTVTATDLSGNVGTKVVTVYVTEEEFVDEITVDEEALFADMPICANGHDLTAHAKVNATCTSAGTEAYYECKECKKLFRDKDGKNEIESPVTIPKHTVKAVKKSDATYTKKGVKAHYECSCGKWYLDKACTKRTTKSALTIAVKKLTVAKPSVKKVTAKSKAVTVKWTKKSKVTGYEVQVALKKNFKTGLKKTTVKSTKVSTTISKLKGNKKYYVRVRAYKVVEGKKFYSDWSAIKTVKTKK